MSNTNLPKAITIAHKSVAVKNSIKILLWATINRFFSAILLFIIMFLYITKFSDEINGITRSVSQTMILFSIIDGGIGTAIVYKLYKPLFNKDWDAVNDIFSSANKIFKKIGALYILVMLLNCCVLPLIYMNTTFSAPYIIVLVLSTSFYNLFGYLVSGKYSIILSSDQKDYVINRIKVTWTFVFATFAISSFFIFPHTIWYSVIPILVLSFGYFVSYIFIMVHMKLKYPQIKIKKTKLKLGKLFGNAFAHQLCFLLISYLDTLILSLSSLKFKDSILITISVYAAFSSIAFTIRMLFKDWLYSISSSIGQNLNFKKKISGIFFNYYEFFTIILISFIFICFTTFSPFFINFFFGKNYPSQYFDIWIAILLSVVTIAYLIRVPYWALITSYGHFKETRMQAIIELIINVSISLVLVWFLKVYGVLIGTIVSSAYRYIVIRRYCIKNFIKDYNYASFYRSVVMFLIIVAITLSTVWININIYDTVTISIMTLFEVGISTMILAGISIISLSLIFKYKDFMFVLSQIKPLRRYQYFKNIYNKNIVNLH